MSQVLRNIIYNFISFGSNIAIAILLTPYLVSRLGVAAYGILPLTLFFTEYIGVITQSINSSISRYLTISINNDDIKESNTIYSTAIVILSVFCLLQLALVIYPIANVTLFIDVPLSVTEDIYFFLYLMLFSFSISLFSSIYSIPLYSFNRLDIIQKSSILGRVLRLFLTYLLFESIGPSLINVALAILLSNIIVNIYLYFYKGKIYGELAFSISDFDKDYVPKLFSTGGWLLINQIGFLLFLKIDLLIVNKFLGAESAGEYAIASKFSEVLRSFTALISGVAGPLIYKYYSEKNSSELVKVSSLFIEILSFILCSMITFVIVFGENIISMWMGENFGYLSTLVVLLLFPLCVNLSVTPLFNINVAYNKIKWPALATLIFALFGLVVSLSLISYTTLGLYSVAIGSGLALYLKNFLFTPLYASKILRLKPFHFFGSIIKWHIFQILLIFIMITINYYLEGMGINILSRMIVIGICILCFQVIFLGKRKATSIYNILVR